MIIYRLATPGDNEQLIELTAASGMESEISLRIDRRPDFFKLLNKRGDTKVFVALHHNKIIGSICVSQQYVYVDEQIFPLQYVGDFKVTKTYRNQGVGLKLCDEMANYVIGLGADLAFLNVAKGNTKPISFFKNRPNIPDFENIGIFNIHQFIGSKKKYFHPSVIIESSPVTTELIQFLNRHYATYQLGTVISEEKLGDTEIYIIRKDKCIIAAMVLADTMNCKQNVVTGVSWKMKYLLKSMNALSGILQFSKMPVMNEPVQMIYIKYLAVNNNNKELVKQMIRYARNIVYEKHYSFVSIGVHEKDPLNKCFSGMLKLTFNSAGMLLSIKNNQSLIEKVKLGVPFEDYSLV